MPLQSTTNQQPSRYDTRGIIIIVRPCDQKVRVSAKTQQRRVNRYNLEIVFVYVKIRYELQILAIEQPVIARVANFVEMKRR